MPVLGLAQVTTWIASVYAHLLKQISIAIWSPEVIGSAIAFAEERDQMYATVSKARGYFLLVFLAALGSDAAINAFVDYAHYFFSGPALTSSQTRDEL